ncbi:MAG: N-acetylmuramoyl-L-alanine amidase, partial [Firmicutes bacterium]|nr:N-acetylmuramoyl-L-alanine amidase [Bacillota bacterium]
MEKIIKFSVVAATCFSTFTANMKQVFAYNSLEEQIQELEKVAQKVQELPIQIVKNETKDCLENIRQNEEDMTGWSEGLWLSSNPESLEVSASGVMHALQAGKAKIFYTGVDGQVLYWDIEINDEEMVQNNEEQKAESILQFEYQKTVNITTSGYFVEAKITSNAGLESAKLSSWTVSAGKDDLVEKMCEVVDNLDGTYSLRAEVLASEHDGKAGNYANEIIVVDQSGNSVVSKTFNVTTTASKVPTIVSIKANRIWSCGYIVESVVKAPDGLSKEEFQTYTSVNGSDDLVVNEGIVVDNGNGTYTVSCEISTTDHAYESGKYVTKLITANNMKREGTIKSVTVNVPTKPVLKMKTQKSINITKSNYGIECVVESELGLASAEHSAWSSASGKDDLTTVPAEIIDNENGTYTIRSNVDVMEHKGQSGTYVNQITVVDEDGTKLVLPVFNTKVPASIAPTVSSIKASSVFSTGYIVTCTVKASDGLSKAEFLTYTSINGKDDLITVPAEIIDNGNGTYTVKTHVLTSDHKDERGKYFTQVKVYNSLNKPGIAKSVTVSVPKNPVCTISNAKATNITRLGYEIEANVLSENPLDQVTLKAWVDAKTKRDLKEQICEVENLGDGMYKIHAKVSVKEHGGLSGKYTNQITVATSSGTKVNSSLFYATIKASIAPTVTELKSENISYTGFDVSGLIKSADGLNDAYAEVYTSKNGKDDLEVIKPEIVNNNDGTYALRFNVSILNHNNEARGYVINLYTFNALGKAGDVKTLNVRVPLDPSTLPDKKGLIVCIDPGHQAHENTAREPNGPGSSIMKDKVSSGTRGVVTRVPESLVNLQVALKLEEELISRGYTVVMCRTTQDVNISNAERAQIANDAGADIFIRIHCNGIGNDSSIHGMITNVMTKNNKYNNYLYEDSYRLAKLLLEETVSATGAVKFGDAIYKRDDL